MPSKSGERKRRPLKWEDETLIKVFSLVFEGRYSLEKIALDCTIPLRTLKDWIAHPEFQSRLVEKRADILAACDDLQIAYARKEQRIVALAQMAESARQEYEARTWLQEKRQIGFDKEHEEPLYLINESFNKDAHAAFRESLDDIAKELGHRKVPVDHSGTLDVTTRTVIVVPEVDNDDDPIARPAGAPGSE